MKLYPLHHQSVYQICLAPYLKVGVENEFGPKEFQKPLQFAGWVLNG
jgi:hypothetical protein